MSEARFFVTGATGFVGSRLTERLIGEYRAEVRVGIRRYSSAAPIARLPVVFCDTPRGAPEEYDAAVRGCDAVFHCAHDFSDSRTNLAMASALVEACARNGIPRLVYLSSFSAYIPLRGNPAVVSEETEWTETGWEYAANKRAVTELVLDAADRTGLGVTVLEPPCVYGPYSFPFTSHPVQQLRTTRVIVPHDDEAVCNLVHIDDLVDAMMAAATEDAALNERFIISGDDSVTWREFYQGFAAAIGQGEVISMRRVDVEPLVRASGGAGAARRAMSDPAYVLRSSSLAPVKRAAKRVLGERRWERARAHGPLPLGVPDAGIFDFRWARYRASSAKAKRLLGYRPVVSWPEGLAQSSAFVSWARL